MSVTRLLLSGFLVASGLILAVFTLHGSFDPHWSQKQASGARGPALKPWSTNTFESKGVEEPEEQQPRADAKVAAAKDRQKRLAEKRRGEKQLGERAQKGEQEPQQAALEWPWSWLSN